MSPRIPAFLIGCIGTRSTLTYMAYKYPTMAQKLAPLATVPAVGWVYLSTIGTRDTGIEVFGGTIWWQNLRPLHAALWGYYSYLAYLGNRDAWKVLAVDTSIGLLMWLKKALPILL